MAAYKILLETGDALLQETGDYILLDPLQGVTVIFNVVTAEGHLFATNVIEGKIFAVKSVESHLFLTRLAEGGVHAVKAVAGRLFKVLNKETK